MNLLKVVGRNMTFVFLCSVSLILFILHERVDILDQNIVLFHELIEALKLRYFESHDAVVDEFSQTC